MTSQYENTLRILIMDVIGDDDNSQYGVSSDRIEKWKEKRQIDLKKNKGVSFENRVLYYSDFYDLKSIILKNWELFMPILKNKKRFEVFFDEVESFRNTVAHGRNLTLSQENLLQGITSDLKNIITIYHNKNEVKEDFFIRINKVNDNLGNIWNGQTPTPKPILRVGDDYELLIEANDPKDRVIEYEVYIIASDFHFKSNNPRLTFQITNGMVSNSQMFFVKAGTPHSDYRNEALTTISVAILPK